MMMGRAPSTLLGISWFLINKLVLAAAMDVIDVDETQTAYKGQAMMRMRMSVDEEEEDECIYKTTRPKWGWTKKVGCNELFEPPKDKLRVYTATILGPPKAKNPVIQTVEFWFKKIWCPPLPEKENVPKARKTQVSAEVLPTSVNTTLPGRGLRPSHTRSKSTFNVIDMKYKILSGTFNRLTVRVHHQNNISDLVEMQTDFLAKEYI